MVDLAKRSERYQNLGDVRQLAGLLEGEGCFVSQIQRQTAKKPIRVVRVCLQMTDKDVVDWAGSIMKREPRGPRKAYNPKNKSYYKDLWVVDEASGPAAIETMLAVFPYMGIRRRTKIEQCLTEWEHNVV